MMDSSLGRMIVVADGSLCTGFRLAGIQDVYAREGKDAEAKIEQLLGSADAGILITSEKTMEGLDWRLRRRIERAARPVVIAVPDKSGPMEEKTGSLRDQIKKALGFELIR